MASSEPRQPRAQSAQITRGHPSKDRPLFLSARDYLHQFHKVIKKSGRREIERESEKERERDKERGLSL